jgi:hypothetical protein
MNRTAFPPMAVAALIPMPWTSPAVRGQTLEPRDIDSPQANFVVAQDGDASGASRGAYLVAGAVAGALIGALIASSYTGSGCDQAYVTCTNTGVLPGILIGAGIGLLGGLLVFEARRPRRGSFGYSGHPLRQTVRHSPA